MKVKDMITGRILLGLESSDQFAEYYGFQEILRKKRDDPEVMIKRVRAVSASRIQSLARKYFLPERENLAVIGPYQGAAQFETLLN
jgi:predicted Zn-dependent peptidase